MSFKKLFISLFLSSAILGGYTSCSDDDKEESKDFTTEYQHENFVINGVDAFGEKTAKVDAKEIDQEGVTKLIGKVTLKNIVVGEPELVYSLVTMVPSEKNGEYTFEIEDKNENRDLTFKGTVTNSKLNLTSTLKINSSVVGDWEMLYYKGAAELVMDTKIPGNIMLAIKLRSAADQLKPVLGEAVKSVSLNFSLDGQLKIGYTLPTAAAGRIIKDETTTLPINFDYFMNNGVVNIAISKEVFELLEDIIPDGFPITVEQLKTLVESNGLYYILPLNMEDRKHKHSKEDFSLFYLNEAVIKKALPILATLIPEEGIKDIPYLGSLTKEQILEDYIGELEKADWIKVGLGFKKVETAAQK